MADDDPMAYLAAKRQQLAAMSQATEVARLQSELAVNVKRRMDAIERLSQEPVRSERKLVSAPTGLSGDQEVDFWRQRIAALSAGTTPPNVQVSRSGSIAISPQQSSYGGGSGGGAAAYGGGAAAAYGGAAYGGGGGGAAYGGGGGGSALAYGQQRQAPAAAAAYGGGGSYGYAPQGAAAPRSQVHVSRTGSVDIRGGRGQAPPQQQQQRQYAQPAPAPRSGGGGGGGGGPDPEVDYWREKIARLSAGGTASPSPTAQTTYAAPPRQTYAPAPQQQAAPRQMQQQRHVYASRTGSVDIRSGGGGGGQGGSYAPRGYGAPQGVPMGAPQVYASRSGSVDIRGGAPAPQRRQQQQQQQQQQAPAGYGGGGGYGGQQQGGPQRYGYGR